MADKVALLNEELEQLRSQRDVLRNKHRGDTMPADARSEDEDLINRMTRVTTAIEIEKQRARDAAFLDTARYMDDPQLPIRTFVNQDDDGRHAMTKAGWKAENGKWYAPLANGRFHEMFPEEVLFGPIPTDDPVAAAYVQQTRRVIQPDYRNAWMKFVKNAARAGEAFAFTKLTSAEQNALSEGSDTLGGFTVPVDVQAQIGGRVAQVSVMQRLASTTTTMKDRWAKSMVAPNTESGMRNVFSNDFVAEWVGEVPSQSSIDAKYEMFEIGIKKLRAYCLLSNDLINDSTGLLTDLITSGGGAVALKKDQAFISGPTGNAPGLEPNGILNHSKARTAVASGGMAYDVEGSTSNTISNSSSDAGSAPKIKQLTYQLASQYAANASWLMRRTIQGSIAGLVDASGRPFWNSYLDSGFGRPQMQIEGFPVENSEFVGTDGSVSTTAATTPLIFGDLSAYQIVDRNQLTVRVLTERFGDTDQTGLFLFVRTGGGLWNYDAIRTGYIAS